MSNSNQKPLVSIVIYTVIGLVVTFVAFAALGGFISVLNPKNTKKLVRKMDCKRAYGVLKKDKASTTFKWAKKYMTTAETSFVACMAKGKLAPKKMSAPLPKDLQQVNKKDADKKAEKKVEKATDTKTAANKDEKKVEKAADTKTADNKDEKKVEKAADKKGEKKADAPAKRDVKKAPVKRAVAKKAPSKRDVKKASMTPKQREAKCARAKKAAFMAACVKDMK